MKHLAGLAILGKKDVYAAGQAVLCTQAESRTGPRQNVLCAAMGSQVEVCLITLNAYAMRTALRRASGPRLSPATEFVAL
jgi:hypothetical protein